MCGIAGIFGVGGEELERTVLAMTDCIAHRGPDSSGTWTDPDRAIGFGHRRLAIVDLSPEGHQPMHSASGRFVIVFNGEIFNYQSISAELAHKGHRFRGHSDTEVMLAAFEEWGVADAVKRFIGMFAFALWDKEERSLTLVRDRLGIKPLFYGWHSGRFHFGSELKSFRSDPSFQADINQHALALYLRYGYVPAPQTIFDSVYKLTPGCILHLKNQDLGSKPSGFNPEGTAAYPSRWLKSFWSLRDVSTLGRQKLFRGTEVKAIDKLEALLRESVHLRMIADVPLGAFLSGGIDSSVVVALMQSEHRTAVKTFSIGFKDPAYNEAEHAKAVAAHLKTDHTELYVGDEELLATIPMLPDFYDEPFADSSQIPSLLVSALARREVMVALSGDGGDEIFGGYNRYTWPPSVMRNFRMLPLAVRRGIQRGMLSVSDAHWNKLLSPLKGKIDKPGERIRKLALVLPAKSIDELYSSLLAQWLTPNDLLQSGNYSLDLFAGKPRFEHISEFEQRAMFLDQQVYLPDDNLQKVDRASMAHALEVRVPLLDHRIVEFSAKLPLDLKIRNKTTKWILRQVLYRHVPKELIERPKMGFSVPIGGWLRGPLKDWAGDLLNAEGMEKAGYIRSAPVSKLWSEHLSGAHNFQHQLWNVLMFQSWLQKWKQP